MGYKIFQRAQQSILMQSASVFAVILLLAVAVIGFSKPTVVHAAAAAPCSTQGTWACSFLKKSGVYAMNNPADVPTVATNGYTLVVGDGFRSPTDTYTQALIDNHMQLLDSFYEDTLYNTECPYINGARVCTPLNSTQVSSLINAVEAHTQLVKNSPAVGGYYLLDDYPGNIRDGLAWVNYAIRQVDTVKPTVCAFERTLTPSPSTGANGHYSFDTVLTNFFSSWCNSVALYSYSPTYNSPPPSNATIDWSMSTSLPTAITKLQNAGFNFSQETLIGIPQTFQFNPRYNDSGALEYRINPTRAQIASQMQGFCKNGATTIVAFAWNDGSTSPLPDGVHELFNNFDMRQGFRDGLTNCKNTNYWQAVH